MIIEPYRNQSIPKHKHRSSGMANNGTRPPIEMPETLMAIANCLRNEYGLKIEHGVGNYLIPIGRFQFLSDPDKWDDLMILEVHHGLLYVEKYGRNYRHSIQSFELADPFRLDLAISLILEISDQNVRSS